MKLPIKMALPSAGPSMQPWPKVTLQFCRPRYREQRGPEALTVAQLALADLRAAAYAGQNLTAALESVKTALHNFRAAPLSPKEQSRRAGQLLRYLSLVPIEYERGVSNGRVTKAA